MLKTVVGRVGFAGALLAIGVRASPAAASGFSVARFGGEHGHPTTTNATAVYYNPAGIAFSDGTHVFVDGIVAWRRVTFTRERADVAEPAGAEGANTGRARLFNVIPSPMLGATTRLGDFALGAGFFTPFGGQSSWDQNDSFENNPQFPGAVDGVQRWYSISGTLRSSYVALAVAYRFDEARLSLGASGNLILSTVDTLRARQPTGSDALPTEGRSRLDVTGTDFGFGAGIMYEPIEEILWIGASYQSKPNVSGGMVLEGRLENFFSGIRSDDPVELHQDLPDVYRLGVSYRPRTDLELRLSGDYTRWSVFERQCLSAAGEPCEVNPDGSSAVGPAVIQNQERDWHDTFGVRAGASVWTNSSLELFGGVGFSSNAVPDETLEPALPDWHGVSIGLGGRVEALEDFHVALSYTQVIYVPRDNAGQSELSNLVGPSRGPNAGGHYAQQVGFINVNVDMKF